MDLQCCHGNGYDLTTSLKVLPDKRVVKIFIVSPHGQKYFFVIFPRFKRIITIKKPFLATLSGLIFMDNISALTKITAHNNESSILSGCPHR